MTTFQPPRPSKAALKLALYGPAGSGKTFTALLLAEGLTNGKRVAFVDTEQGTAFYSQAVPARQPHPEAFDFDVLHTRAITDVLAALRDLDTDRYGVLVIDSMTHLWDSCKNAYAGKLTRRQSIPFQAWAAIKKPYKELMRWVLSSPAHVLLCGRQAVDYGEDEATGELTSLGFRMRAEGETAYEPDVLLRLEQRRTKKDKRAVPVAHVEKDRTGVLAGRSIDWPSFDSVARPLLGLLGPTQVGIPTDEEVARRDEDALDRQEQERLQRSGEIATDYAERFREAGTLADLQRAGRELTNVKAGLTDADLAQVRRVYSTRQTQLQREAAASNGAA